MICGSCAPKYTVRSVNQRTAIAANMEKTKARSCKALSCHERTNRTRMFSQTISIKR